MAENKNTKENSPDKFQLAAIKANFNSVVSAGAGSGKTSVLSQRFLDLVENRNCNVDQILTLTFTKKATVEMSSRIYNVLKKNSPDKAADFYKANIKTLDSYCNSLAKMGAHFYGISPDFIQDQKAAENKIKQMSLPFILKHRDNPAIKLLANTNDYDKIATEIFVKTITENSTVVTEIDFDGDLEKQKNIIIESWKENQKKFFTCLDYYMNIWNSEAERPDSKVYVKAQDHLKNFIKPSETILTKKDIENSETEKLEFFLDNAKYFCRTPKVGVIKALKETSEYLDQAKSVVIVLEQILSFVQSQNIITSLFPLMKEFQSMVNSFKRQSGLLSFKDTADIALKTLIEHPEIRRLEKEKYKAIMIDEFQDNNQMQKDLLFLLAEKIERTEKSLPTVEELCPDKLFFVGDEKQSIYRFRGADVSVFRNLSSDFKEGNLQMTTNYRSHQALIAAFNTIFGGYQYPPKEKSQEIQGPAVFFTEKDLEAKTFIPPYEAVYHKVTLSESAEKEITQKNFREIYKPHIHIAKTNDAEIEAEWVAQKIKELTEVGIDGKGPVLPGDIAILFKSYDSQSLYERMLLKYGIPYNTETVKGFFSDGPVNDIFSFLRLCVYPTDTLSYAQILRSPFVNLSITEVNAILLENKEAFSCDNLELLSADGIEHYKKAKDFYQELKTQSKTLQLTDLINTIWYKAGYRYETLWNQQVFMYSKLYDLIFEFARQCQNKNMSLAAFVDELKTYKNENSKLEDMDIPIVQSEGVHLMSIHKSKGLEFKVVFLPVTNKGSNIEKNSMPVYYSKEYGLTVNTKTDENSAEESSNINFFFSLAQKEETLKANAELRRLTYVSLTRAIDQLYISKSKEDAKTVNLEKYMPGSEDNLTSIYNTLLPVLTFYKDTEDSPFSFEDIKIAEEVNTSSQSKRKNTQKAKVQLLEDFKSIDIYNDTSGQKIISLDEVLPRYISPSLIQHDGNKNFTREELIELWTPEEDTPFKEINNIVIESLPDASSEKNTQARFTFANFGTIAHSYLESALSPEKALPEYSNKDIVGLENNAKKLAEVERACKKMTSDFLNSPLGKKALAASWKKCEYNFKYHTGKYLIHGTMDLIIKEDENTYRIVDYKTNQSIKPELYYNQLTVYREAASQILGVPLENIKCSLFYLRFAHESDITQECNQNIDWQSLLTR